jgi:hypothetical protein
MSIKKFNHFCKMSMVEQFSDYQLAPVDDLPSCVTDDNIEQFWGEMGKLDDIFSGTKRFGVLSKLLN